MIAEIQRWFGLYVAVVSQVAAYPLDRELQQTSKKNNTFALRCVRPRLIKARVAMSNKLLVLMKISEVTLYLSPFKIAMHLRFKKSGVIASCPAPWCTFIFVSQS